MTSTVNGFVFDELGNLDTTPDTYTMQDLRDTYAFLIRMRQYISASRINHLMNTRGGSSHKATR